MEGVPRLPMLSFELKQSPSNESLSSRLREAFAPNYGDSFSEEIREFETLRANACIRVARDVTGVSGVKKYYSQLYLLKNRFDLSESLNFSWIGLYEGGSYSSFSDVSVELSCVLYNSGALHTFLASAESRVSSEEMKMACTHFQCAAWAFHTIPDRCTSLRGTDLDPDVLAFLSQVCLAQAQECILEKSILDHRKAAIVSKVGAQVADYYRQATKKIDGSASKNEEENIYEIVGSKTAKLWLKYSEFKTLFYTAVSFYYTGLQSEEAQKMGERVAFLEMASNVLGSAISKAKELISQSSGVFDKEQIMSSISFTSDVINGKLDNAKKENDFVYHEKVPDLKSLPDLKGASLVKGIGFEITDIEISGQEIFSKLVPMEAYEANSLYSEETDKLLRSIGEEIEKKDGELAVFLSSLSLDEVPQPGDNIALPPELIECAAGLSVKKHAVWQLTEAMNQIDTVSATVESTINQIKNLFEEEDKQEEEYQIIIGEKRPSHISSDLRKELEKYMGARSVAAESTQTLHEIMTCHLSNFKLLEKPLDEIQKSIPSMADLDEESEANVSEVHRVRNKVEEMKNQRVFLMDQFRKEIQSEDITKKLIAHKNRDLAEVFKKEIQKYDGSVQIIRTNLNAQNNILQTLANINAKYAETRLTILELLSARKEMIQSLIDSYHAYEDILHKAAKGLQFYDKLDSNVSKLLNRVKGVVNVQSEERDAILARKAAGNPYIPSMVASAPPTSSTGGKPTLKDYLNAMKNSPKDPVKAEPPGASPAHYATSQATYTSGTIASSNTTLATASPHTQRQQQRQYIPTTSSVPYQYPSSYNYNQNTVVNSNIAETKMQPIIPQPGTSSGQSIACGDNYPASFQNQQFSQLYGPQLFPKYSPQQQSVSSSTSSNTTNGSKTSLGYQPYPYGQHQYSVSGNQYPSQVHATIPSQQYSSQQPNPYNITSNQPPNIATSFGTTPPPTTAAHTNSQQQHCAINKQQLSVVNQQQPSVVNQQYPSIVNQQHPSIVNQQQPSVVNQQQPSVVHQQQPSVVNQQQPSVVNQQLPSVVNQQQPSIVNSQQPLIVNQQQPSVVNQQKYPIANQQQYPITNQQQPPVASRQQHPFTNQQPYVPQSVSQQQVASQICNEQSGLNQQQAHQHLHGQQVVNNQHQLYRPQSNEQHFALNQKTVRPQDSIQQQITLSHPQVGHQTQPHTYNQQWNQQQFRSQMSNLPSVVNDQVRPQIHGLHKSTLNQEHLHPPAQSQQLNSSQSQIQRPISNQPMMNQKQAVSQTSNQHSSPIDPLIIQTQGQQKAIMGQHGQGPSQQHCIENKGFQSSTHQQFSSHYPMTTAIIQPSTQGHQQQFFLNPQQPSLNPSQQLTNIQHNSSISLQSQQPNGGINQIEKGESKINQVDKSVTNGRKTSVDKILSVSPDDPSKRAGEQISTNQSLLKPKVMTASELEEEHEVAKITKDINQATAQDPFENSEELRNKLFEETVLLETTLKQFKIETSALDKVWKEIKALTEKIQTPKISVARCYPMKNKFPDVLPFDFNRVELPSTKDDYINASHIKGLTQHSPRFIATQAPSNGTLSDFWTMVWQEQVETLVNLLPEDSPNSFIYYPLDRKAPMKIGQLEITLQSSKTEKSFIVEKIFTIMNNSTNTSRVVIMIHITKLMTTMPLLLDLVLMLLAYHIQQRVLTHPLIVHCASGSNATASVILLASIIAEINVGSINERQENQGTLIPSLITLSSRLCHLRKGILREKESVGLVYQALFSHCQNILAKYDMMIKPVAHEDNFEGSNKDSGITTNDMSKLVDDLSLIDSASPKRKITKQDFLKPSKGLASDCNSDDPLSQLDPLWSLKNK